MVVPRPPARRAVARHRRSSAPSMRQRAVRRSLPKRSVGKCRAPFGELSWRSARRSARSGPCTPRRRRRPPRNQWRLHRRRGHLHNSLAGLRPWVSCSSRGAAKGSHSGHAPPSAAAMQLPSSLQRQPHRPLGLLVAARRGYPRGLLRPRPLIPPFEPQAQPPRPGQRRSRLGQFRLWEPRPGMPQRWGPQCLHGSRCRQERARPPQRPAAGSRPLCACCRRRSRQPRGEGIAE
mmetsp:Transcript_21547/g.45885  ORF Transcript_21547/g.45885 Transcript_21547/m.45885 type:complete len:234 (-) Transcript_21547:3-704(-)